MRGTGRLIGAALSAMLWSGLAGAEAPDRTPPARAERGERGKDAGAPGWRHLDLTAEQKERMVELRKRHQESVQDALARWKSAQEALQLQVQAVDFNEQAIRTASRKAAEAAEQLAVLRARNTSEVRALLTPEQKAQWDALRADRQSRRRERNDERRERIGERRERRERRRLDD